MNMPRISRHSWAASVALLTSRRSTCIRRQVGCVLLNARGHVLSTGYNGVASGMPHCNEGHPCAGANQPSGQGLDLCQAIHAEQNALLQCRNAWEIDACYVTASPCMTCVKLLLNTTCNTIYYLEEYPHPDAQSLWTARQRRWIQLQ